MRSRNSNFKVKGAAQNVLRGVGISSTGILVLLGIIAISPITNKADAANGWDEELKNYRETASTVTLSMDSGTNSVVNAGNTNTNVGVVKRTASVTLGNTNGYSVYIRANSANLTGSNSSNTIPSVTSNSTLSQMTDKWGWNGNVSDSVTDCSLSDVFKQMTTSNQTLGTGGAVSSGTKKITICFGTRVSEAKVADTYSNTVTLSVVAQPGKIGTFNNISTMQELTPTICSAADYHETAQLTDTRDNKKYWVTKMLDGNCWMSQNLDLDLGSTVTAAYNDNPAQTFTWTVGSNGGMTSIGQSGIANGTYKYAWDVGDYVIIDPTVNTMCDSSNAGISACSGRFIVVGNRTPSSDPNFYKNNGTTYTSTEYDAHYLVGNYYQWNAATAGTGGTIASANATGSICPKNWKLPSSATYNGAVTKGTHAYLLRQYGLSSAYDKGTITGTSGINSNTYNVTLSPLFFVRGGNVEADYHELRYAGQNGYYWTTLASSSEYAQDSYVGYSTVYLYNIRHRYQGHSLRCLVQTP